MLHMFTEVTEHSLMITSFVFVMMLVIEYLNVLTKGRWEEKMRSHRWEQCLLAAALGASPGCLGAYVVVSLYAHRVISFGALVAAMIATSGDESFLMLALFPGRALGLFGGLLIVGFLVGVVVDLVSGYRRTTEKNVVREDCPPVHADEDRCVCFSYAELRKQWRHCLPHRGILVCFLLFYLLGIVAGEIGHGGWGWMRITLLVTAMSGLFIVASVPDHFLEEHLWNHIARVHIWKIFLWAFGALLAMHVLLEYLDMAEWMKNSRVTVLLIACLVGLIPQSGPHMIFVTLYSRGEIPLSILVASSVVQDGHGMLPLLAHSRRAFVLVKLIGLVVGLSLGLIGYFFGW